MPHLKTLSFLTLWSVITGYSRDAGTYATYQCRDTGKFMLHCPIPRHVHYTMEWKRCANNVCAVIYQRTQSGINIDNVYVFTNGTISDTCNERHGWSYKCIVFTMHSTAVHLIWGIDNTGVSSCKYRRVVCIIFKKKRYHLT